MPQKNIRNIFAVVINRSLVGNRYTAGKFDNSRLEIARENRDRIKNPAKDAPSQICPAP